MTSEVFCGQIYEPLYLKLNRQKELQIAWSFTLHSNTIKKLAWPLITFDLQGHVWQCIETSQILWTTVDHFIVWNETRLSNWFITCLLIIFCYLYYLAFNDFWELFINVLCVCYWLLNLWIVLLVYFYICQWRGILLYCFIGNIVCICFALDELFIFFLFSKWQCLIFFYIK